MRVFYRTEGLGVVPFLLLLLLSACVKVGTHRGDEPAGRPALISAQPQVSLLLYSREPTAAVVRLTLGAIELSDGKQWISLLRKPQTVSTAQAASGMLVDRMQVPTGQYDRIRYRITQAVLEREGRETQLQLPPAAVDLPLPQALNPREGESLSLFLNWDVAASLAKAPRFSPAITPAVQQVPLTTELAYVSCPEINTIYLIRTDQNRICASWGVSGRPTYLHAVKERNLLYVLAAEQGVIKVVELSSGRIQDQIRVPMAVKPSFMTLDRGGKNAYLLDQVTGTVYRVNLGSGSLAAQGRVGERLDFAVFLDAEQLLAVSSERSHQVLLLDPLTLQIRQAISVGSSPQGVLGFRRDLYVAEGRANTVSVRRASDGATRRQPVGLGPSRLLAHGRTIFVANSTGGTIAILLPEQLTVLKQIRIGGTPGEMGVSPGRNWLYVVDGQGEGVAALDLTSQRLAARIELLARPLDIEVIQ